MVNGPKFRRLRKQVGEGREQMPARATTSGASGCLYPALVCAGRDIALPYRSDFYGRSYF